jgi:signal transduction histidine kinase
MRSLLAAIHSLAHYERNAPDVAPDAKLAFDHIIATTDTLQRWVRDITHTVRPFELKPVRQQIEPIIHDSLALLNPRISEKAIEVEFEPQDDLPAVHLDRTLFEQALVAIVTNAIDASPHNGRIAIVTVGTENGTVTVRIEDEGAGMNAEIKKRIFDQFFTTKPQAAGLGLTIADKIVALHGGKIEIDSQPEKGTRVSIHLPTATGAK